MVACSGCSIDFPDLTLPECSRCTKKQFTSSSVERDAVDMIPQCTGCGSTYQWLKGTHCGACIAKNNMSLGSNVVSDINRLTSIHEVLASEHRLNQRPQNAALQSAAMIKQRTETLKKLANKSRTLDIVLGLWVFPADGGAAKKAQLTTLREPFDNDESADTMFDILLDKAQDAYKSCPAVIESTKPLPLFTRKSVLFSVQQSATEVHQIDNAYLIGTAEELFAQLKGRRLLSDKDAKSHSITLRLFVYDIKPIELSDDEFNDLVRTRPKRSAKGSKSSKRKASTARTSSPKRYRSAYRLSKPNVPGLQYDDYEFRKTIFSVNAAGEIDEERSSEKEVILISRDWRNHIESDRGSFRGGFIGSGYSKFVFKGRLGDTDLAISQLKTADSCEVNEKDLHSELRLTTLLQYFVESFYSRANAYGVSNLPAIKFNSVGAFIGKVTELRPAPSESQEDTRSLRYGVFMAAPLLESGPGYVETKFSGNDDISENTDVIGRVMDAFTHHVLADSRGTILPVDLQGIISPDRRSVCLFDPQAHTDDGASGFWDQGSKQIKRFWKEHKCNAICQSLKLDDETEYSVGEERW